MDYSPIVAQVWGMLTWLIPATLLIGLFKSPWAKGQIGELLVRLFAHWQLDKQTYRRLHNVTLNTPDGTTQIDHVFLSPYGIFVLETKNMSGWIFGSEKQAQWTGRDASDPAFAFLPQPESGRSPIEAQLDDYEHFLSRDWDQGYRAARIAHLIETGSVPILAGVSTEPLRAMRSVGFDSFEQLQSAMIEAVSALGEEGLAPLGKLPKGKKTPKAKGAITYPIADPYLTNPIARASALMAELSANAKARRAEKIAAE